MAWFSQLWTHGKENAFNESESKILRDDRALKSKLQETTKHVPRYLFRMWHPKSGGNANLNTTERITPLAFLKGKGHKSVYDMSVKDFVDNTTQHLHTKNNFVTEFSSWSASPRFVFHYATSRRETACIAIIDTQGLQMDNGNAMFHVPALQSIFGHPAARRGSSYEMYNWEYLVHGVVEGEHYKAVSFRSLCDAGLIEHLPALKEVVHAWGSNMYSLPPLTVPFSKGELQDLDKIARLFGSESETRAAITIALFCCKKRTNLGTELKEDELKEIVQYLGGRNNVPHDWCDSLLLCNGIYDPRYEDNKQMVNVMRAVSTYCWGKRARGRFANQIDVPTSDADVDSIAGGMSSIDLQSPVDSGTSGASSSRFQNGRRK
ncbi:hypothetical protein KCV07_g8646, partial [Aureobasidium melanogenum]